MHKVYSNMVNALSYNYRKAINASEHNIACVMILIIFITLYSFIFIKQSFFLYDHFSLTAFDLGIYDQATWLISHGYPAFVTVRGLHLMADHFTPIFYIIAPFYMIKDSPKTLLVIQTISISIGALPLYFLAYKHIKNDIIAVVLALISSICSASMEQYFRFPS